MRQSSGISRLVVEAGLVFLCAGVAGLLAQEQVTPLGVLAPTASAQQQSTEQLSSSPFPAKAENDYVIGPEDMLRIDVFQVPELSNQIVRVSNAGTITVPLLGQVQATGLTATQLAQSLEAQWGQTYLQNPVVTVLVQEFHSMPVSVVGAVEKPGLYYMTGPRTLIEILSLAGGLAKRSSGTAGPTVYVTRQEGFGNLKLIPGMRLMGPEKVAISIKKLLYSSETALNIPIHPLDIISVDKADTIYVTGSGVVQPGGFVLRDRNNVTVIQALAMAHGLGPNAAKRHAFIIRQPAGGPRTEIHVDLKKILKGKASDPVLVANDILFVPNSGEKAGLKHAMDAAISTMNSLLLWGKL